MEKSDKMVSFRLPQEIKKQLERQAEAERRSVSNLLVKIVMDYLEAAEQNK